RKSRTEENGLSEDDLEPPKLKKMKGRESVNGDTGERSPEHKKKSFSLSNGVTPTKTQCNFSEASSGECDSEQEQELTVEQKEGAFSNFCISKGTIELLRARGVTYLFPVQVKTFKHIYDGKDVVAQARTGTGKTFSFAIPLIEKLQGEVQERRRGRTPKVLVLTPTRELANQVARDFKDITKILSVACFYGGTAYSGQIDLIRSGIDILVGTPGRIKDHLQNGKLDLSKLKHVVLDEVDQMLDMGFAEQVEDILRVAYKKDTCCFHILISKMGIMLSYFFVKHIDIIFWPFIHCHNNLVLQDCQSLHGDIPQNQREITLKGFRNGVFKVLVATNVAARGLDIPEVDLVVQSSPPKDVESYIHRSGRTGRAGRTGMCVCFYQRKEESQLRHVEQKAGITFKRIGVPTATDIIKASSKDAIRCLDSVPQTAIDYFKESAQGLIEEKGAVEALAAALAHISGATSIEQRSLLNSDVGFVTMTLQCSEEINNINYAWRGLREQLGDEIDRKVNRMCLLKGKMGVCFDILAVDLRQIQGKWQDSKHWHLTVATQLPELAETQREGGRGFYDSRNGRRGDSFNRNRFRNRDQKRSFD
uniref:RNA helicase n=1 Tax=Gopherus evgoodei TaxID=1825980 RepID=A0A8C4Y9R8_9SAUR